MPRFKFNFKSKYVNKCKIFTYKCSGLSQQYMLLKGCFRENEKLYTFYFSWMPVLIQNSHAIDFRLYLRSLPGYSINGESPVRCTFTKAVDNFMYFLSNFWYYFSK